MSKEFHSSCSNKKKFVNLNSTILKWNDINQSNKNPNKYYSIFSSLFYADRKMNATFQSNTKFFFWRRNLLCLFSFKYSNRILFQLLILTKSHLFIFFSLYKMKNFPFIMQASSRLSRKWIRCKDFNRLQRKYLKIKIN